jgi:hypothetical protein
MRVLELNDLGLRLFDGETVVFSSPGHAALDGKALLTGDADRVACAREPHRR